MRYNGRLIMAVSVLILALAVLAIVLLTPSFKDKKVEYNCDDFAKQKDAQMILDNNPKDIYNLDGDNDGLACEHLL